MSLQVTRRRWGYFVWVVALGVTLIPECLAASERINRHLPFSTISGTVGHLEFEEPNVALIVIAVVVFLLVSILRAPPKETSGGNTARADKPHRTAGGRLTFKPTPAARKTAEEFDNDPAPWWFLLASLVSFAALAGGTIAARVWWPDPPPAPGQTNALFHAGYVLYGAIALLWFVVPSVYVLVAGKETPFPTLFRSITNLEQWLRAQRWAWHLGPRLAWLLIYVLAAGLTVLMVHLILYPFPDISHVLNPTGE